MIKSSYEVELLVNGKPLKEYLHQGKMYVEGRKGTKFSLRLRNNSSERKLFVPTIDGLSIMDGKEASYKSSGYIVRPWSTVTIDGWRKSDSEIAEFYFSNPSESYGSRKGKGTNLGVIGCAVFSAKLPVNIVNTLLPFTSLSITPNWFFGDTFPTGTSATYLNNGDWEKVSFTQSSSSSMDSSGKLNVSNGPVNMAYSNSNGVNMKSASYGTDLGTGWGDYKKSDVITVDFDREDNPNAVFEVFYNTREQLEKLGINFKREPLYVVPQAFPGQFCEPPQDR